MAARARRRRTIGSMMVLIAGIAAVLMVVAPLWRRGPAPCLTALETTWWLVERPGAAKCADCHADAGGQRALAALVPATQPPCAGASASARGASSCVACHGVP